MEQPATVPDAEQSPVALGLSKGKGGRRLPRPPSIMEEAGLEDYRLSHTIWNPNKPHTLEEKETIMESKWRFRT